MKAAYNTQNVALMGRVWRTPKKQSRYHRQLLPTEILPVHSKLRESSKNASSGYRYQALFTACP